jgi:hypothetical protein
MGVNSIGVVPNPAALPIFGTLQSFIDAIGWLAIMLCLAAIVVGAIRWAFGSGSSNPAAAAGGKNMVIGGAIGAAVVGAASQLIHIAYNTGATLH